MRFSLRKAEACAILIFNSLDRVWGQEKWGWEGDWEGGREAGIQPEIETKIFLFFSGVTH
jgi:hypothetical protein